MHVCGTAGLLQNWNIIGRQYNGRGLYHRTVLKCGAGALISVFFQLSGGPQLPVVCLETQTFYCSTVPQKEFFLWLVYYIEPKARHLIHQLYIFKASEAGGSTVLVETPARVMLLPCTRTRKL